MRHHFTSLSTARPWRHALIAGCLCAAATAAHAAPFRIGFQGFGVAESGSIASNIPGTMGGRYDVTLIVDNGGTSPNNQTWTSDDIRCVRWNFRRAGSSVYEQRVSSANPIASTAPGPTYMGNAGTITTDASGALTRVFDILAQNMTPTPGTYTLTTPDITSGATPYPPNVQPGGEPTWYIPSATSASTLSGFPGVFYLQYASGAAMGFDQELTAGAGTGGGTISTGTTTTGWTMQGPVSAGQLCAGQPLAAAPPITPPVASGVKPVPTLGLGALIALSAGAVSMGAMRLRRRPNQRLVEPSRHV